MSLVCPVCYEEYSTSRPARILRNCGHDLCDLCIRQAVRSPAAVKGNTPSHRQLRCPSCRAPMISAEVGSDHLRILTGGSSVVHETMSEYADLAELLIEELFPKSVALTHINSRIDLTSHHRQELTVRDCETDVLMLELRHRIPSADACSTRCLTEGLSPPLIPETEPDKDGGSEMEAKLEKVMIQMAMNLRTNWTTAEMGLPRSYTDGLEDMSLSMIWLFLLWLLQAGGSLYTYICFAPNRYWQKCRPEEKIQVLAIAQGIPLFLAACYYCAGVSR